MVYICSEKNHYAMKKTILLIGLGVAFVVVSAWVFCSGGRSARAVRAKFRLGGAILTLVGMTTLTGCVSCYDQPGPTCYDPAPPPTNSVEAESGTYSASLRDGDIVVFNAYCMFPTTAKIDLLDKDGNKLSGEEYTLEEGSTSFEFTINAKGYEGLATIELMYHMYNNGDSDEMFKQRIPILIVE